MKYLYKYQLPKISTKEAVPLNDGFFAMWKCIFRMSVRLALFLKVLRTTLKLHCDDLIKSKELLQRLWMINCFLCIGITVVEKCIVWSSSWITKCISIQKVFLLQYITSNGSEYYIAFYENKDIFKTILRNNLQKQFFSPSSEFSKMSIFHLAFANYF